MKPRNLTSIIASSLIAFSGNGIAEEKQDISRYTSENLYGLVLNDYSVHAIDMNGTPVKMGSVPFEVNGTKYIIHAIQDKSERTLIVETIKEERFSKFVDKNVDGLSESDEFYKSDIFVVTKDSNGKTITFSSKEFPFGDKEREQFEKHVDEAYRYIFMRVGVNKA